MSWLAREQADNVSPPLTDEEVVNVARMWYYLSKSLGLSGPGIMLNSSMTVEDAREVVEVPRVVKRFKVHKGLFETTAAYLDSAARYKKSDPLYTILSLDTTREHTVPMPYTDQPVGRIGPVGESIRVVIALSPIGSTHKGLKYLVSNTGILYGLRVVVKDNEATFSSIHSPPLFIPRNWPYSNELEAPVGTTMAIYFSQGKSMEPF